MARHSLRDTILDAGLKVMFRSGYNGSSVRDIVAAAGAPQGSFTNHFRSKEAFAGEVVGEAARLDGTRRPVARFESLGVNQMATGAIEAMSLWAGESVGGVRRVQPAAEIVRELAGDAERLLRQWG